MVVRFLIRFNVSSHTTTRRSEPKTRKFFVFQARIISKHSGREKSTGIGLRKFLIRAGPAFRAGRKICADTARWDSAPYLTFKTRTPPPFGTSGLNKTRISASNMGK